MAKKLPKTFGSIDFSIEAATILAVKENDDVIYVFNKVNHKVTLKEAERMIPNLLSERLKRIDILKERYIRDLAEAKKELVEIKEICKLIL